MLAGAGASDGRARRPANGPTGARPLRLGPLQSLRGGEPAALSRRDRGPEVGLAPEQRGDLVARALVGGAVGEPGRERGALLSQMLQLTLGRECRLAQRREAGALLGLALALRAARIDLRCGTR
jgi:hypothetical protein